MLKEKIKYMNSKMAISTCLPTSESKKQNKQTGRTETDSQIQKTF